MTPDEINRLRHMRDGANAALTFAAGRTLDDVGKDLMLQFALIRALEIVGEAASKIGVATRSSHPEIPWLVIVGMRNRLIHGYYDVDMEILWKTVNASLGPLVVALEAILHPLGDEPKP